MASPLPNPPNQNPNPPLPPAPPSPPVPPRPTPNPPATAPTKELVKTIVMSVILLVIIGVGGTLLVKWLKGDFKKAGEEPGGDIVNMTSETVRKTGAKIADSAIQKHIEDSGKKFLDEEEAFKLAMEGVKKYSKYLGEGAEMKPSSKKEPADVPAAASEEPTTEEEKPAEPPALKIKAKKRSKKTPALEKPKPAVEEEPITPILPLLPPPPPEDQA